MRIEPFLESIANGYVKSLSSNARTKTPQVALYAVTMCFRYRLPMKKSEFGSYRKPTWKNHCCLIVFRFIGTNLCTDSSPISIKKMRSIINFVQVLSSGYEKARIFNEK